MLRTVPPPPTAAPDVLALLEHEPSAASLLARVGDDHARLALFGLQGSASALFVTLIAHRLNRPLLLVVPNQTRLYDMEEDILFFRRWLGLGDAQGRDLLPFPHIETLPYEDRDPQLDIRTQRAKARQRLAGIGAAEGGPPPIWIAPIRTAMRRLPPSELSMAHTLLLQRGGRIHREELSRRLDDDGYEFREMVCAPGQFAVRGGIVDVFPVAADAPCRIELFGDEIDSIRVFDVATQRSLYPVETLAVFPSREHTLAVRHAAAGNELACLLDMLPADAAVIVDDLDHGMREAEKVEALAHKMYRERQLREDQRGNDASDNTYDDAHGDAPLPLVPPAALWEAAPVVVRRLWLDARALLEGPAAPPPPSDGENARVHIQVDCLSADVIGEEVADRLATPLHQAARGERVAVICDNQGQVERLRTLLDELAAGNELWRDADAAAHIQTAVGTLHNGFGLPACGLRLYTDRELFHRYKRFRAQKLSLGEPIHDIVELKPGDFVVHVDHGIARYVGMTMLDTDEGARRNEFLELRFADNDTLYVPLEQMERVGRYVGSSDEPPALSKLGTKAWGNAKARARKAIEDMAEELLELYAKRQLAQGRAFSSDTTWQREFEASFVYTETPDQWRSIEEAKRDMEADKPMDRLICGDVGFGKTEVAIRAAFKAVMDGAQVAMLVPTTVLAEQHYRTFRERMADFPVRIEMLSRFRTPQESEEVKARLANGEIDIVIGTHALLGARVKFKSLGLVIIDEEQRFGVKHKERLKQLRTQVDVLTMSATPIPRTLYMSLSGIRDMSVVNTPPRDRLPIETYVMNWKRETIESAILRELSRGGQVYFVHNEVRSIVSIAHMIQEMIPQARVCVGHGQMGDRELETVMRRFVDGDYDVLVSTTIIESGIDIPNVNTIIINRADQFGLAQLYQLRGRVGRSHHQAYCYLLVQDLKSLTPIARRRLSAIQEFNELGAGFQVALRDLEIRGMGNVLGRAQSGHIAAIGFELYNQMLRDTVKRLRQQTRQTATDAPVLDEISNIHVSLGAPALLVPSYVPSGKQRMALHKRFARLESDADVDAVREELQDMYGRMPDEVSRLLDELRLKILARKAGVLRVKGSEDTILLQFGRYRAEHFNPLDILALDQQYPGKIRLRQQGKTIGIELSAPRDFGERLKLAGDVLRVLEIKPQAELAAS